METTCSRRHHTSGSFHLFYLFIFFNSHEILLSVSFSVFPLVFKSICVDYIITPWREVMFHVFFPSTNWSTQRKSRAYG